MNAGRKYLSIKCSKRSTVTSRACPWMQPAWNNSSGWTKQPDAVTRGYGNRIKPKEPSPPPLAHRSLLMMVRTSTLLHAEPNHGSSVEGPFVMIRANLAPLARQYFKILFSALFCVVNTFNTNEFALLYLVCQA